MANGNAKFGDKAFITSKASTLRRVLTKALTKGPSQVYDEVFEEEGKMMAFESLGDISKGRMS